MWLYVPDSSRQSRSVRAVECSMSELTPRLATRFALSSTSNGKLLRPPTWRSKWRRVSYLRLLSGVTLTPLQARRRVAIFADHLADELICSSAESRASRTVSAVTVVEKVTIAIYGREPLKRLRRFSPNSYSSKTFMGLQLHLWDSRESRKDWKNWITLLRQDCSARKALVARVAGFAVSPSQRRNWPTPTARDYKGVPRNLIRSDGRHRMDLLDRVAVHFPDTRQGPTNIQLGLLLQKWRPPRCPQLNASMSEWVMGWPCGLTGFDLSVTAWTRWYQELRSYLSLLVCGSSESKRLYHESISANHE